MIEWNYAGDADITIGEVHISKTSKILLILLIIGLVILGGLAIYFRAYIYDYIANPSIILTDKEIELEINSDFNPEEYIANSTEGYTYEIIGSDIDTSKLNTYRVTYNSKNKMRSNSVELIVNVVDTTAPEIELIKDMDLLVRGKDTDNFNPSKYIKKITDNYSDEDNIKVDYTTDIDFSKDTVQIVFTATDENDNVGTKTLNLAIFENQEELEFEQEKQEEQNNNNNNNGGGNNGNNGGNNTPQQPTNPPPATEQPTTQQPTTQQPQQQGRSISGVHNVTKSWADQSWTLASAFAELTSGVSCTGDSVQLNGMGQQIAGPGTYTFTWVYTSDGSTAATCYIIVTD